jgi:hypothetical protein
MTGLPLPTLVFMLAAGLVLGLEGTGARAGERKQMGRAHIAAVVVAAAVVAVAVAAVVEPWTLWTVAALGVALVTFAACEPGLLGERAALALGLTALCALFGTGASPTPLESLVCLVGAALALGTLAIRPEDVDADPAIEAGTRALFMGGAIVGLVGVACLVPDTALGGVCLLVGLALGVGLPPLHGPRVDLGQGAPPGVAALAALPLVAIGPALARLVAQATPTVGLVVCVLGGVGLPLVALAQVSMRRLLAVLATMQVTLPVAAALVGADVEVAAAVGAFAVAGLAGGAWALPSLSRPLASWEDNSGVGRLMPWRAGLVVFAAAFACGLPPTMGFGLRRALAVAAHDLLTGTPTHPHAATLAWLPLLLLFGGALAALPVVRLALFLFGKTPRTGADTSPRTPAFLVVGSIVGLAVVLGALGCVGW